MPTVKGQAGPPRYFVAPDGRGYTVAHGRVDADSREIEPPKPRAGWTEVPEPRPGPGKIWDFDAGAWVDDPEWSPPPRTVPANEFRDRFTDAELVAVMRAAQTDDEVAVYWALATTTESVNLNSARVDAGLDLLEAKGLLAVGRKAEILA